MKLLLIGFVVFALYQCAGNYKEPEMDIMLRNYMEVDSYNGKVIKYIRAGEYNDLFIYFTDNDSIHLRSYKYPIHWIKP